MDEAMDFGEEVVIGALVRAADIHAGAIADGFEALEDFDVLRGIAGRVGLVSAEQLSVVGLRQVGPARRISAGGRSV